MSGGRKYIPEQAVACCDRLRYAPTGRKTGHASMGYTTAQEASHEEKEIPYHRKVAEANASLER